LIWLKSCCSLCTNQMSFEDPTLDDNFNVLATLAQYGLFLCNVAAMKYFFRGAHFALYLRKTFRHELTWLFLVIFVIRFSDLILHKQNAPAGYAVHAVYLVGVFVKHLSRLMLLQMLCSYRFQSAEKLQLFPVWKLLLYVSTNIIDCGANIARLSIFYVFQMASSSAAASPVTKAALIIFVGDMLYYYYNTRLVSAFLAQDQESSQGHSALSAQGVQCRSALGVDRKRWTWCRRRIGGWLIGGQIDSIVQFARRW
jgi:hypothetical protein